MTIRCANYPDDECAGYGRATLGEVRQRGGCQTLVADGGRSVSFHWCTNKAKDGEPYCGVHNDAAEAKRKAKREERQRVWHAKWDARAKEQAAMRRRMKTHEVFAEALQKIADGHNDPRSVAIDALRNMEQPR